MDAAICGNIIATLFWKMLRALSETPRLLPVTMYRTTAPRLCVALSLCAFSLSGCKHAKRVSIVAGTDYSASVQKLLSTPQLPTLRWANGTIIRADGGEAISGL